MVFTTTGEVFGPSPTEVKANTSNSYSVLFSNPVTSLLNAVPLLMVKVLARPTEPLFWKNNLNPMIIPFLESAGGNCQDAVIIVEVTAVTLKLLGACDGAAIEKL